jgi:hypothetical protein
MTATQEAIVRPARLTTAVTAIFALLGLIDVALTGVIGSSVAPPLAVSLGVAALGLITLGALVPARRGSRPALITVLVSRVISAILAAGAFVASAPVWVMIVEGFVIVATITALVMLRQESRRTA